MIIEKTYKGTLNGVFGFWGEDHPEELIIEEIFIIYYPDEGKIFKKDDEYFEYIIQADGIDINDYEEVDIPEEESSDDDSWEDLLETSNETTIE